MSERPGHCDLRAKSLVECQELLDVLSEIAAYVLVRDADDVDFALVIAKILVRHQ